MPNTVTLSCSLGPDGEPSWRPHTQDLLQVTDAAATRGHTDTQQALCPRWPFFLMSLMSP